MLVSQRLTGSHWVSGAIPEPRNARITSVNLHSTLHWDPPRFPKENITYTVQYKSTYMLQDSYESLCAGLRLPRCELSSLSAYGDYELRLRAEAGPERSGWLGLRFRPMENTTIGPPEVRLRSEAGALHADFWGPLAERSQGRWPLKQYYGSWKYRILYWRRGSSDTQLASASQVWALGTLGFTPKLSENG
uniref:Fibronectin type-III domain-containing protein n=1 Tax=Catharus ustulatus TaxID=91951 RepID=A0A8C3U196_CATUS